MKKNIGITLYAIGMSLSTLGMTVLNHHTFFQYTTLTAGLLIMIYSVFLTDREKRNRKKIKIS